MSSDRHDLSVLTLVIWMLCLAVGAMGLGFVPSPYRAAPPAAAAVVARFIDVQVAPRATVAPAARALPNAPQAAPGAIVAPPPLAAIAFAQPVNGPIVTT